MSLAKKIFSPLLAFSVLVLLVVGFMEIYLVQVKAAPGLLFFNSIIAPLAIFLLVGFSYHLRRHITVPISKLIAHADHLSRRDFSYHNTVRSRDEIGKLAAILRQTTKQFKEYEARLETQVARKDEQLKLHKEFELRQNEFISIASHELKTPVTSQKLFVELLRDIAEKRGHKEYGVYLAKVAEQSDKLVKLVSDLLDVARIEGKKLSFNFARFSLNQCVREAVEDRQLVSPHHLIMLEEGEEITVCGDRDRVGQVVTNFLSNAIKYSPQANKVIVRVGKREGDALVSVQDFGIGIDAADHSRLFERFFRVSGSDEKTFPGMGVGLFICSEIIKGHQGRIWVESEKGRGSTFHFALPLRSNVPAVISGV